MASVRENLIAAKAVLSSHRNPLNAIRDSAVGEHERTKAYIALRSALPDGHAYVMQWLRDAKPNRAEIAALFDRAIDAQEPQP